jgi:flagellar motor switch protein FliM
MNEHIKNTKATVVVRLGEAEMTLGDLLTLETGDIIPLDQDASGEVSVAIEGVEKMKCLMGTYKGNRAVQITKVNASVAYERADEE